MPELPEVEIIAQELQASPIVGKKIKQAKVFWERTIATPDAQTFCQQIEGQKIEQVSRRGKFLVFKLSRQSLLVHLRMTGQFAIDKQPETLVFERVQLLLEGNYVLHYKDQRKFGKWFLVQQPEEITVELGLEPLSPEFTLSQFEQMLKGRTGRIKSFLLDQHHIAGLGNIYVDEALWQAKIHPERGVDTLTPKEVVALHRAIPDVLSKAIANKGTSLGEQRSNYMRVDGGRGDHRHSLKVYGRKNMRCTRCKTPIIKIVVSQRGTHLCPTCQQIP